MITTDIGLLGEQAAVEYIQAAGYTILERNWRTRLCEIDIIAHKQQTLYIFEVKYRGGNTQGFGLDYVTPAKMKRLWFAAQLYIQYCGWDSEVCIGAVEVSGETFAVTGFVESITFDL